MIHYTITASLVWLSIPLMAQAPDAPYKHPLRKLVPGSQRAVTGLDVADSVIADESGRLTYSSGAYPVEKRRLSAQERAVYEDEKEPLRQEIEESAAPVLPRKLGKSLQQALSAPAGDDPIVVHLRLDSLFEVDITHALEDDLLHGRIRTSGDYDARRRFHLQVRQGHVRALQDSLLPSLRTLEATVLYRCKTLYCLTVSIPPSQVEALAEDNRIVALDLEQFESDDATIAGDLIIRGTQIKQFIDSGYDGENSSDTDITVAIVEAGAFNDEHVLFRNSTSSSVRIDQRYSCDTSPCTALSTFPTATADHATAVAGIIFGDLRDGQDSRYSSTTERVDRSGYAGEAHAYLYTTGGTVSGTSRAYDHIPTLSPFPRVANRSGGFTTEDPLCLGESPLSQDANDLYETGILLIKTAGNEDHGSSTDCTVNSPGAAIGVFTVGGHGNSATGLESDVRAASIYSHSSRGGTSSEGKGRSIVDVTAYAGRSLMADRDGNYSYSAMGTSFSAPTVTAGAIDFVDFYKQTYSNLIDNPGILFANLLLMGDRQGESGKRTSGFDSLWGAGRFKMRRWSSTGMDSPYQWRTGSVCVGQGQTATIAVNDGAAISSDADDFKAVIFWYDRRHETGTPIDDIDLRLKTLSGSTLRSSLSSTDNKERVYYSGIGGQAVQLEIYGYSVTSDLEGCGTNSMRVYYALFYEDDDRDDSDGPGSEIDSE